MYPTLATDRLATTGGMPLKLIVLVFAWLLPLLVETAQAAQPLRLVVLDPGHAEILEALGVGDAIELMPNDPSFRNALPQAARYLHMPSIESILAAQPTLLIGGNPGRDLPLMEQAQRLGIHGVMVRRDLPTLQRIRKLAVLAGRGDAGQRLIDDIEADYAAARELIAADDSSLRVLHVSSSGAGSTGSVTAAGRATAAHGLIERSGGLNVGAEAGLERYQTLSAEGVIAMAPQVVLVSSLELAALGGREHIWERVTGLAHTPAGRQRRLVVLPHRAVKFDAAQSGEATLALARELNAP